MCDADSTAYTIRSTVTVVSVACSVKKVENCHTNAQTYMEIQSIKPKQSLYNSKKIDSHYLI